MTQELQGKHRDRLPLGMPALPGERVMFETRGWFAPWLWIIYLIIPAFFVWWVRRHRHLIVTNRRLIYTEGIFNKKQRVMNLQRVQDVGVAQGIVARIFGYGDLLTESAGEMTGNEMITYLSRVRGARDAILSAVHEEGSEDRGV